MMGIQLMKIHEPDGSWSLEPTHDILSSTAIDSVCQELKHDKKFCDITKNWNIYDVHKAAKKPEEDRAVAFEKLRVKVQRDMDLNLAENLNENLDRKTFHQMLKSFVDYVCDELGVKEKPILKYKNPEDQGEQPSFAAYCPSTKEVIVMTKGRHIIDVCRSVAHEIIHHHQNLQGRLGKDVAKEGSTGSDIENEANAGAGIIMRKYGKANPHLFGLPSLTENVRMKSFEKWRK
jgi:hypothetical protein